MNRKIQPEIQTLKDFRILPPVRTTLPNGIPLTVINAGEQDVVRITVYSLNKYVAETLEVVESMIKEPLFPEKELHTILDTNIQQYLVNTSKVDFLAHRSLLQSLYGEQHPCGKVVVEEDYHAITPEVLRNFYERN